MGSYSGLYFDDQQVNWMKNDAPLFSPILFSPNAFHQVEPRKAKRPVRAAMRHIYDDRISEWTDQLSYYWARTEDVWERLRILGYGPDRLPASWDRSVQSELKAAELYGPPPSPRTKEYLQMPFDRWVEEQRKIFDGEKGQGSFYDTGQDVWDDPLDDLAAKIVIMRPRFIWADLTDVIDSGYGEGHPHEWNTPKRDKVDLAFEKILVLTEGASDKLIITESMRAFYPKLADLYSFVDFDGFNVEGGAHPMARLLKGLVGAGYQGRVIALFDNDAAGHAAVASIRMVEFPSNVRVATLPDIRLAEKYPTLGPTGATRANINGSGCAIELYLGRRSLTDANGLIPFRWSEFNSTSMRYQGRLTDKDGVQERYLASIRQGLSPSALRRRYPEMDVLLRSLFSIFA